MIVNLCGKGHCPVVEIGKSYVKIGEKNNICKLKKKEWNELKRKVIKGEL